MDKSSNNDSCGVIRVLPSTIKSPYKNTVIIVQISVFSNHAGIKVIVIVPGYMSLVSLQRWEQVIVLQVLSQPQVFTLKSSRPVSTLGSES